MDKLKLAILTHDEEKDWTFFFAFYVDQGLKDDEADYAAWKDVQAKYPRLKEYSGCRA